jgi:hypothetical protein
MTRQGFLDNFYLIYDKFRNLSSPSYEPQEIEVFATEAQESLVISDYRKVEITEEDVQNLGELVETIELTPSPTSTNNLTNGSFFDLPNTSLLDPEDTSNVFWFPIYEEAHTNDSCKAIKDVIPVTHGEYRMYVTDPFNRPNSNKVWRLRVNEYRHELITDGNYVVNKYKLRYIKKPQPIILTSNLTLNVSELSNQLHYKLLRRTLLIALKDTVNSERLENELKSLALFQ